MDGKGLHWSGVLRTRTSTILYFVFHINTYFKSFSENFQSHDSSTLQTTALLFLSLLMLSPLIAVDYGVH